MPLFGGILASTAGDIALTPGARGGVYIGGGISSQILRFLKDSTCNERFCQKGPMSDCLNDIPVYLMHPRQLVLIGAAAWFDPTTPKPQLNPRVGVSHD